MLVPLLLGKKMERKDRYLLNRLCWQVAITSARACSQHLDVKQVAAPRDPSAEGLTLPAEWVAWVRRSYIFVLTGSCDIMLHSWEACTSLCQAVTVPCKTKASVSLTCCTWLLSFSLPWKLGRGEVLAHLTWFFWLPPLNSPLGRSLSGPHSQLSLTLDCEPSAVDPRPCHHSPLNHSLLHEQQKNTFAP